MSKAAFFMSPAFMGLAAAAAAVGAAYLVVSEDSARAEEAAKRLKKANDQLKISFDNLHGAQVDVDNQLLVATGAMTQQELALANVVEKVRDDYLPAVHILNERLGHQLAKQKRVNKETGFGAATAQNEAAAAVRQTERDLQDLENQQTKLIKSQQKLINLTYENAEANDTHTETTVTSTAAKEKELSLSALAETARLKTLDSRALLEDSYEKEIELINKALKQTEKSEEDKSLAAEARKNLKISFDAQMAALDEAEEERAQSAHEKELTRLAKIRDANEKTALQVATDYERMKSSVRSSLMELFDAFDAGFEALLGNEKLQEEHAGFLRVVFALQKAAAVANIALKVQEGLAVAASLPPPADGFKTAAVLATGAITTATVLAEPAPFHSGGIVSAPDEVDIRAQTGEGVVNRTGMASIGPDGLAAINRGQSSQQVQVQMVFRHKIFDEFVVSNLKRSNSPLRNAIRTGGASRGLLV
jgi:hypothetical protein